MSETTHKYERMEDIFKEMSLAKEANPSATFLSLEYPKIRQLGFSCGEKEWRINVGYLTHGPNDKALLSHKRLYREAMRNAPRRQAVAAFFSQGHDWEDEDAFRAACLV